jgi:RimJ/RimL family protein N-acetyltransferase
MKIDVFVAGIEIDLICLTEEIASCSNWYQWFNDERITATMQRHYYPNTKALQVDYFKNYIESNTTRVQCGIYHKKDNLLIGVIALNNIDFINRTSELSGFIGEKNYQSLIYFVEAHKLLLRHGFETLNLNKVIGGTIIKELDSLFCRALGYSREGLQRKQVFKNGQYMDVYLFGLLKGEFDQLKKKWF